MQIGLILPHFGRHATTSRLVDGVAEIERLGFDSVWVRDHVVYDPHAFEDPDITFIDPFVALSAAAVRTTRLLLGTATLIPHRHPVHSAMLLSSLARLVGPERLVIGWGIGNDRREFTAVAAPGHHRGHRLDEHVGVVRRLLAGGRVSHDGEHYQFEGVRIMPAAAAIAFWYGGGTPDGIARAGRAYEGLLASRIPRSVLAEKIIDLRRHAQAAGRPSPAVGLVTMLSPGRTVEEGMAAFDVSRVHAEVVRRFPTHGWALGSGLEGVMMAGPPGELAAEIEAFQEVGVDHLVLDLRARFDAWDEVTAQIAGDVLPRLRRNRHDPAAVG